MTKKEFNKLYEEVKSLSKTGEVDDNTTTLYDWMAEGDCEGVSAEQIANEWDEVSEAAAEATEE